MSIKLQFLVLLWLLICCPVFSQDDAIQYWKRAFTLSLQGDRLESADLKELALASCTESLRQFQFVAKDYPEFQSELVGFRIEQLKQKIADLTQSLPKETAPVTKRYLSYLQLSGQAANERDTFRHLKSLVTFKSAKQELEAVLAINPVRYSSALGRDKLLLDSEVLRLNRRYVAKSYTAPKRPSPTVYSSYGSTRYVNKINLPTAGAGSGIESSPSLFPGR